MAYEENATSNITQALTNLFEEMLYATGSSGGNKTLNMTQFLSALKERSTKHNHEIDFGTLVKLVDGWKTKLNFTKSPEPCNYCDGSFRDLLLAYNSIHGFISLIVSMFYIIAYLLQFSKYHVIFISNFLILLLS